MAEPQGFAPERVAPIGFEPDPAPSHKPISGWDWSKPETFKDSEALAALKEQSRQGGILAGTEKAHSIDEHVLQALGTIPLFYAGGVAGRAAPLVRMATAGGLAKARGEGNLETAIDVAGTGIGEAGGAGLRKIAQKLAGPAMRETARQTQVGEIGKKVGGVLPELEAETDTELWDAANKWGRTQVERVMDSTLNAIKPRLGRVTKFAVPSLGPEQVSLQAAYEGFKNAPPELKAPIRWEIMEALNAIDPQKEAGKLFAAGLQARAASHTYLGALAKSFDKSGRVDPEKLAAYVNKNYGKLQTFAGPYWPLLENALLNGRKAPVEIAKKPEATRLFGHTLGRLIPEGASKGAERALPVLKGPGVQAGIDAVTGQPPLSTLAIQATGRVAGPIIRHTPGTEGIRETLREIEEGAE